MSGKIANFRVWWLVPIVFFSLVIGVGASSFFKSSGRQVLTSSARNATYSCPMHPSVTSDHPDKCPICHMDLQKVEEDGTPGTKTSSKDRKLLFYRNPMRPDITSPTPAKDEMGMDYIPVYEDETLDRAATNVSGRASFSLSQERQQLIGVTTALVEVRPIVYEVRANGKVAFDPELFTAIEEYRQAVQARSQMKDESLKLQSGELITSSRTKLKLMGLGDDQIRKLGTRSANPMNLLLPKGNAWIYAEVFEYELAGIKSGQGVEIIAPSVPGETFSGKIASISPVLNAQNRTVRVRALVPDPKELLRPDTFVNVKIKVDIGEKLAVPPDSVLHSGDQDFVFVVKEQGHFEPRAVTVGYKAKDFYEVKNGLSAGETVATAANFLIDSESRLRAAVQNAKTPQPQTQKAR